MVIWGGGSRLAFTLKTNCVCTISNSSPDLPGGDLGGSGLAFTVKTYGFCTIWNSSADSLDSADSPDSPDQVTATAGRTLPNARAG